MLSSLVATRGAVLIICDDAHARARLVAVVEARGYEPVPASDGILGLRIIDAGAPLLVAAVVDLATEGARGASFVRQITSFRPRLPVIAVGIRPAALGRVTAPLRLLGRPLAPQAFADALAELLS